MKVVMLRVGIDTGSGGIHGPLFRDGSFEYIPIPDTLEVDERTYGNTIGIHGQPLIDYFPASRRTRMRDQPIHFDPEFRTFTYGDPTRPKGSLRRLEAGDMLIFYCGLQGWDFPSDPALYLMGYFEVSAAGRADDFAQSEVDRLFEKNFHVRHRSVYRNQLGQLVLVKGSPSSRLLDKAVLMSTVGQDRAGRPLKVLSSEMQEVFGGFGGRISFQRSPPRWVDSAFAHRAAEFMRSLD